MNTAGACRITSPMRDFLHHVFYASAMEASRTGSKIVLDVCLRGDGILFELLAVVVMPDHVHLALVPRPSMDGPVSIPEVVQAIKSTSVHRINRELERHDRVWQQESFDRALRREEQVDQKIDYMLENPVRAGFLRNPMEYPWIWRKTEGWERIGLRSRTDGVADQ